jgi:hypothetical protein
MKCAKAKQSHGTDPHLTTTTTIKQRGIDLLTLPAGSHTAKQVQPSTNERNIHKSVHNTAGPQSI